MLLDLKPYRDRINAKEEALIPDVRWNGRKAKVLFLPKACGHERGQRLRQTQKHLSMACVSGSKKREARRCGL